MRGRGSTVWRGFSALVGVAVLAVAAGCSGDPAPVATTPAPVVSATPTPTPTPVVSPEPPAAMSEPTTDGAIAAATHFLALSDYAFSSGDIEPLMAMSAGDCSYCTYLDEQVTAMVDGNYSSEADPLSVVTSRSTEIRPDEWFSAELRVQ